MVESRAVGKNEERWIIQQLESLAVDTTPGESRVFSLAVMFFQTGSTADDDGIRAIRG